MRWPRVLLLGLALMMSARAEDWTTADGNTYKNVTVLNKEDDGVRITYAGGVGKIPYYELPVDIQKRFGQDIESLAAKKKAVDQALAEAVRNAIAAEQMVQAKTSGAVAPPPRPPTPAPPSAPPSAPMIVPGVPATSPDNQASNSGSAPTTTTGNTDQGNTANNSNTAPQNNSASGSTPSNATGNPASNNNATGNNASSNPSNPQTTPPGSAQASTHPGPGAPANGGKPGMPGSRPDMPALNDYTPGMNGGGVSGSSQYIGSKLTYNEALDLCYLDSPSIDIVLVTPLPAPHSPKQTNTVTLRITTEGRKAEEPEKIEITFLCVGGTSPVGVNSSVKFMVDGTEMAIDESAKKDASTMGGTGQPLFYLTFYLTPEQMKTISGGKSVQMAISPAVYKFDGNGMAALQAYQKDIDGLPKASSSFMRSYYKLLSKIPSFVSILSTACEYLILGTFALLVCASIAAFIMGITRFIKM